MVYNLVKTIFIILMALSCLKFFHVDNALANDPRSKGENYNLKQKESISTPGQSFDGRWITDGRLECLVPYPSLSLNTENMIIKNGKFYVVIIHGDRSVDTETPHRNHRWQLKISLNHS